MMFPFGQPLGTLIQRNFCEMRKKVHVELDFDLETHVKECSTVLTLNFARQPRYNC